MKPPQAPKPFPALLAEHGNSIGKILQSWNDPAVNGQYLHWDQLRRRSPPTGLSHEQWWLGTKFARTTQYRVLPHAQALDGRPFVFMLPDQVLEGLHRIDSRMHGIIGIPESTGTPGEPDRFIVNSLIEEAIKSSQLEGASSTREEAANMLRSGRHPGNRSERMILNNYRAMQAIREMVKQPMRADTLLELHRIITAGTLDDEADAGRMQRPGEKRVFVSGRDGKTLHRPPPAEELDDRLARMMELANRAQAHETFVHPVVQAIALHFLLAYDHPFADGNGRTARALFYWSMLRSEYWLFQFVSISRYLVEAPARYARSFLYTETDENDLTYFIDFQVRSLLRAISDLERYIARKTAQVKEVESMLRQAQGFNHRQLALLAHALRTPRARYTVRSHRNSHAVANGTARRDLLGLCERGLLNRRAVDQKTHAYIVPPDLAQRIRSPSSSPENPK